MRSTTYDPPCVRMRRQLVINRIGFGLAVFVYLAGLLFGMLH